MISVELGQAAGVENVSTSADLSGSDRGEKKKELHLSGSDRDEQGLHCPEVTALQKDLRALSASDAPTKSLSDIS